MPWNAPAYVLAALLKTTVPAKVWFVALSRAMFADSCASSTTPVKTSALCERTAYAADTSRSRGESARPSTATSINTLDAASAFVSVPAIVLSPMNVEYSPSATVTVLESS